MTAPGARRRLVVALAPLVVTATAPALAVAVLRERLPARAHGTGGHGDATSWLAVALDPAGLAVVATLLWTGWFVVHQRSPVPQRGTVGTAWGVAAALLGYVAAAVVRNLDRPGPPPAPAPMWAQTPLAEIGVLLVGALGWWLAGRAPAPPPATAGPGPGSPRLTLATGEQAMWTRSILSRRAAWAAVNAVVAVVFVLLDQQPQHYGAVLLALLAAVAAAQARVRVVVDAAGVRVVQPLLRRTLTGIRLEHVREAGVRPLAPGEFEVAGYGVVDDGRSYGYRATRAGEVLALATSDGREFVVTVDDAATAAALVNALVDRRREVGGAHPDRSGVERPAG